MIVTAENQNPHYNDCYFSSQSGLEESLYVFIEGNCIPEGLKTRNQLIIGETGFGTGLNLLALIKSVLDFQSAKTDITIDFYTVELYPLEVCRCRELLTPFKFELDSFLDNYLKLWDSFYKDLQHGWNNSSWEIKGIKINFNLYYGDVKKMLKSLPVKCHYWFLDGHSPDKNPQMWSYEVMKMIAGKSGNNTRVATFTAAGSVKRALREAGFTIKRRKGFGPKRHMIQGIYSQ